LLGKKEKSNKNLPGLHKEANPIIPMIAMMTLDPIRVSAKIKKI